MDSSYDLRSVAPPGYGQREYMLWIKDIIENSEERYVKVRPASTEMSGDNAVGVKTGVFTKKSFAKSEPIAIFDGIVCAHEKAGKGDANGTNEPFSGIFQVHGKWMGKGMQLCVDSTQESQFVGQQINHSKFEPNARPMIVYETKTEEDTPRIAIVAKKDIPAETEVQIAYTIQGSFDFPWDKN